MQEADADPSQQGLGESSADGSVGFLTPVPIADGGSNLVTKVPGKTDAGVVTQGDAGQADAAQGDAGQTATSDAGAVEADAGTPVTLPGKVRILNTTGSGEPNCNAVYFRDLDGDGFGDSAAKVTSCTQPAGYVEIDGDCYDNNERAFPGATGQFLQHRGDGKFDFDCDGVETKLHTEMAACPDLAASCTAGICDTSAVAAANDVAENSGWTNLPGKPASIPACGREGAWGLDVIWYPGLAKAICTAPSDGTTRVQTCR